MYNYNNLLWVKNVKRDKGNDWAYNEPNIIVGSNFNLHWPSRFRGNVRKPQMGELILLFQTVNNPRGTYLTHIITPIDMVVKKDLKSSHPYYREVKLLAKADPIDSIKKPADLDFYRPNRGACCKLSTIKNMQTKKDVDFNTLQKFLWNQFLNHFAIVDSSYSIDILMDFEDDESFLEGDEKQSLKLHKYYERNQNIVRKAKEIAENNNRLYCEICNFEFSKKYLNIGNKFIECHHKLHISSGEVRKTTINDLALVCSNCHRMLHKRYNEKYLSVDELRNLLI